MRRLYTVILYVLLPYLVIRLWWKGRRLPAYRQRVLERFFLQKKKPNRVDVWLHAVSLGEVVAATPLIEALLAQKWQIMITTMTPTGSQQVITRFQGRVLHQYIPYDYPAVLRRFFQCIQPRVGIVMETELWPNLIYAASAASVPLVLVNGRISDKAMRQYRWVRRFFRPILSLFHVILAQSEWDAERFRAFGSNAMVHSVGNLKFDLIMPSREGKDMLWLRECLGATRTWVVAASTHEGEEQALLMVLPKLKQHLPDALLVLVPRHPERFAAVYALSQRLGFKTGLRSQSQQLNADMDVVIIDTMGELLSVYQVSDYAFVGGSLVPVGGHNVLEPIALQVPVFCGPFMQNSKTVCEELKQAGALKQVATAEDWIDALLEMHQHPMQRLAQVQHATQVLNLHQGAVTRCLAWIEPCLRDIHS